MWTENARAQWQVNNIHTFYGQFLISANPSSMPFLKKAIGTAIDFFKIK